MSDISPAEGQPILDIEGTLKRLKGDQEFLQMLYGVYIGDLPQKLESINAALAEGNLDTLLRSAHSLKGASATVGAEALRGVAFAIETAARQGRIEDAAVLVPSLKKLADQTSEEMRRHIPA